MAITEKGTKKKAVERPDGFEEVDYGDLWGRVSYLLLKIRSFSVGIFSDLFFGIGLAPGQYHILYLIGRNPGSTQIAIGNAAGIDRSTIAPIVDRFEKMGWVRRTRRPENRRAYALELTAAGKRVLQKSAPLVERFEDDLVRGLTDAEHRTLVSLLTKMYDGYSVERPQ